MTLPAQIENAMLRRLEAAGEADALGYRFRTLESYPEEFDDYLKQLINGDRAFPAAWSVFGGWGRPVSEGAGVQAPAVFMLVVAAQNLRNEKARRQGVSASEVGSYQLVMDAVGLLHGQHLGLDIQPLQVGPLRSIRLSGTTRERQLSVFAIEFTTLMPIEMAGFPVATLDDFSTFHADWDVPPHGNVSTDLPAPAPGLDEEGEPIAGAADAVDHLELPS